MLTQETTVIVVSIKFNTDFTTLGIDICLVTILYAPVKKYIIKTLNKSLESSHVV